MPYLFKRYLSDCLYDFPDNELISGILWRSHQLTSWGGYSVDWLFGMELTGKMYNLFFRAVNYLFLFIIFNVSLNFCISEYDKDTIVINVQLETDYHLDYYMNHTCMYSCGGLELTLMFRNLSGTWSSK